MSSDSVVHIYMNMEYAIAAVGSMQVLTVPAWQVVIYVIDSVVRASTDSLFDSIADSIILRKHESNNAIATIIVLNSIVVNTRFSVVSKYAMTIVVDIHTTCTEGCVNRVA